MSDGRRRRGAARVGGGMACAPVRCSPQNDLIADQILRIWGPLQGCMRVFMPHNSRAMGHMFIRTGIQVWTTLFDCKQLSDKKGVWKLFSRVWPGCRMSGLGMLGDHTIRPYQALSPSLPPLLSHAGSRMGPPIIKVEAST